MLDESSSTRYRRTRLNRHPMSIFVVVIESTLSFSICILKLRACEGMEGKTPSILESSSLSASIFSEQLLHYTLSDGKHNNKTIDMNMSETN